MMTFRRTEIAYIPGFFFGDLCVEFALIYFRLGEGLAVLSGDVHVVDINDIACNWLNVGTD